ncbi:MAG: polysaccharide biosynthesis/export family protein [Planctomycetes bacterium]|nr:polysaccharide biosynthesis/export family protein [Planctomycetota bacterium]
MSMFPRLLLVTLIVLGGAVHGQRGHSGEATTPPATTLPEAVTTPPPATNDPAYRLFVGDMLRIEVHDNPDLFRWLRVPASGAVSFPLIGDVTGLLGRTIEDLTGDIRRRLEADYLHRAEVSITVTDYGAREAYVMGSVAVPGPVALPPTRQLTALQAIGAARGYVEDADRAGTHLLRDDPQHPGRKLIIQTSAGEDGRLEDVILQPGDIVVVPRQGRVYILGQVVKPGALSMPGQESLTISRAISLAGGFERFARQGEVQLIRKGGKPTIIDVRVILAGGKDAVDPVLQPGDTVFVPESRF